MPTPMPDPWGGLTIVTRWSEIFSHRSGTSNNLLRGGASLFPRSEEKSELDWNAD
jgi:hypothetical protein